MYLILLIIFNLPLTSEVEDAVIMFHNLDEKQEEIEFINKYKANQNPSVMAYVIALNMKQAEYKVNPLSKFRIFNKNKSKLNSLIEKNPSNAHLRYIRLLLQESAPWFLAYKKNIHQDKDFLMKKLSLEDESDFLDFYISKNTSL